MTVPPLIPTGLPWVYDLIVGQDWPQADEDALRRAAQAWTEALSGLVALAEGGDSAAQFVGYSVQAVSSDEFDKYWSRYTQGDDSVVGQMAQQCQGLAELLLQNAEQVEFTKLSIDIQVVILAIQLTVDIATAIVTAGASMAEGAAAAIATRFTVKQLLTELLKGALMAVAPDLITQTIMVVEGHRSSIDVGEALQAAGQGALGAGIGMAVGGVTGRLAKSLTGGLAGEAAESLGGKLLTHAVDAGNAAVTGALTNMVTTAVTDVAGGQGLDNVWSAGANGAANGVLFHGAHALGEGIGAATRPEPTHFSLANGNELRGLPLKDGSFALFDGSGMKHGTGIVDPRSGELVVRPVAGEPYRSAIAPESKGPADPVSEPAQQESPSPDPLAQQEESGSRPEPPSHGEASTPTDEPAPSHGEPGAPVEESRPTHGEPSAPTEEPAPPHSEPTTPTDEQAPPHSEPSPPTEEPAPPHSEPSPPTEEPGPPHGEPSAPTDEPAPPHSAPSQPDPSLAAHPEPPAGESATLAGAPTTPHSAPSQPDAPVAVHPEPPAGESAAPTPPHSAPSSELPPLTEPPDPQHSEAQLASAPDLDPPSSHQQPESLPVEPHSAPGGATLAAAEPVEAAATPQVTAIVEHPVAEEASAPRASSNPILDAMNAAAAPEQHAEQFSALGEQPEPPPKPTTPNVGSDEATYLAKLKDPGRRAFHDLVRDLIEERHQKVLPVLEDVRARLGGEFRGEENYRKLAESLDRKLRAVKGLTFDEFTDPAVGKDVAGAKLNELALKINDPLRYTLLFPEGDYARGAAEILQGLHERGFRLLEPIKHGETKIPGSRPLLENGKLPADAEFAKNSWREGNRYLGINLTLVDEHGGPFELQFHTPMSFEVKEHMSHLQYEVFRRPEAPMERRVNAMLELVSLSDKYLWGRIPEGLDEFAPRAKDSGMDELFKKIAEDYGSGAETPEALYQADQKLFPLEVRQEEIRKANQDLAEHLNRLTGGGLSDAEIQQAFLDTVDLLRAREQLTTDPAEWHRLQYETPAYEPPQHGTAPAHPTEEPASHAHQPQSEQPGQHGHHNDPTALGPSATDHAHAHATLHLEHPIALSPDHLVFPFRDETGNQQFAHLQHVGERWVLHAGGPEGEALTALGDHLRTTPPGLDLIGHATPDGFLLGGKTIPFEDVLAHIPAATTGEGPIRLIACDAGGAAGEAARRLADMSGRTVVAADTPVWVTKDGHVVAANPVDRATNWYPKRPPDGVWSSYEPGGGAKAIHPGGPDDQLLPKAPEGWASAHGGSHVEFTDLAGDRSRIDRSARRLLDTLLPKSKDAGFDLDQPLHGESAFWNMIDADHVVRQIGGVLPRAFRGTVDRLVEHAMWLQEADRVDAQRGGGLGTSPDERRPIGSPLSEIGGYLNAELREHPVARNDYASMAGIPIDNKWFGPTSSQAFTMFRESIPEGGVRGGNYQALRENLGVYVHQLPEGRSGQDVAIAMRNLLATGSDEARRANLVELAKELDPGFAGLDQQDWQATAGGKFVSFVTTLSHLVGHIEVGRNPEAITNLMALDLAGRGVISLDDAVGYFNIMHPVGAAGMTRIAHAGDPQQASPAFEAYVPDADRRRFAGNTNHLTVGVSAVEMYERQSRVVAMYAADFARQDPAEWARFQRDPGAYLLDNQWLLIDVLLKKYTNPT